MVKNVERKIKQIEGFNIVIFFGDDGHDVKGNRQGLPQYNYSRAAKDDMTVEAWKANRFRASYPGFAVDVLWPDGTSVAGNTKLRTVRQTYPN